ncbi:hypothetical protein OROGR_011476 [Orobanche gracilis]
MPIGAFFCRVVKMSKKPIMSNDLHSTYEEDLKKRPKRSSLDFEISHQKHYHQPPMVHKNIVEHERMTTDEKRDLYDDHDIDVNKKASRFIEQVRKKIGYGDENVGMENDGFVEQKPENLGLTTKNAKRDAYGDQDIDIDKKADRFIKQVRQKIGMTTNDDKRGSRDDQDINLDTEIDRFIKQRPGKNNEETTRDGKWDSGDDHQDMNIDMAADRFIQQQRQKFGKTTNDRNPVVCDDRKIS